MCMNKSAVIVCKHVEAGDIGEARLVLVGSRTGTEYAVCQICADKIDVQAPGCERLVTAICRHHAEELHIPLTLPGEWGFWHGRKNETEFADADTTKLHIDGLGWFERQQEIQ